MFFLFEDFFVPALKNIIYNMEYNNLIKKYIATNIKINEMHDSFSFIMFLLLIISFLGTL